MSEHKEGYAKIKQFDGTEYDIQFICSYFDRDSIWTNNFEKTPNNIELVMACSKCGNNDFWIKGVPSK